MNLRSSENDEVIDRGIFGVSKSPHPAVLPGASLLAFVERLASFLAFGFLIYELIAEDTSSEGTAIFGIYLSYILLTLIAQVLGGFIVEKFGNYLRSLLWGGFFLALGFFLLPFGGPLGEYPGLIFILLGTCLFGPALPAWLAKHYQNRREFATSGMSFFLGSRAAGSLLGAMIMAYALEWVGWKEGMMISGILLLAGHIRFFSQKKNTADSHRVESDEMSEFNESLIVRSIMVMVAFSTMFQLYRAGYKTTRFLQPDMGKGIGSLIDQATGLITVIFFFVAAQFLKRNGPSSLKALGLWSFITAFSAVFLIGSSDYVESEMLTLFTSALALVSIAWAQAEILPETAHRFILGSSQLSMTSGILNALYFAPIGLALSFFSSNIPWLDALMHVGTTAILVMGGYYLHRRGRAGL